MLTAIISDTHHQHEELTIPNVELLIHCGDFSDSKKSLYRFVDWFSEQNSKYKILVAGNHDQEVVAMGKSKFKHYCSIKNIIYLEDESITIKGIKFHGSPWTPIFFNWSFMKDDVNLKRYWDKIPLDTEVLITHGPQKGTLDRVTHSGTFRHVGSSTLSNKILDLKLLKFHFFGHIHGETNILNPDKYQWYTSCNAAMIYEWNDARNYTKEPIVIDIK